MTNYEMKEIAKMQAQYIVEALKNDDELLDLMYPPRLLDVKEAAAYLHISIDRLYHIIEDVPHFKNGKKLLFSERALLKWLSNNEQIESVNIVEIRPESKKLVAYR